MREAAVKSRMRVGVNSPVAGTPELVLGRVVRPDEVEVGILVGVEMVVGIEVGRMVGVVVVAGVVDGIEVGVGVLVGVGVEVAEDGEAE